MTDDYHQQHKGIFKYLKSAFAAKQTETVRETIEDLLEEAGADGKEQFSEHEQLLLSNILYLKDKKCCQAMIPRADIIAFQQNGIVADLAKLMVERGHSRIPIYGESLDDVVGILHIIDLANSLIKGEDNLKVKNLVSNEVKFVSPCMRVLDLLREMQADKIHMAMVVDEYGGIDGLVTIEDLLEEIVGNIEDEYDTAEQHVIQLQEGLVVADARAELSEIKEIAGIDLEADFPDEELSIDTLGGLVFHIAQRIPNRGEVIDGWKGIKFRILDVDPRRIKKVMIILQNVNQEDCKCSLG